MLVAGSMAVSCCWGQVELRLDAQASRVEVTIQGEPFVSYLYGTERSKPILFPVRAPGGRVVTRGVPIGKGESSDHPHQESLWLSYGDVNGLDFWTGRGGEHIRQRSILRIQSGTTGILEVLLDWLDENERPLLQEIRKIVLGGSDGDMFWLDHQSDLRALQTSVHIGETKEGLFGIRVADDFREDRGGATYLDAFGRRKENSIWGTRVPWVALQGTLDEAPLTLALFDHPSTYNHPSYWHARAYGLFAANPLGRKDFVKGAIPTGIEIRPGETLRFRYRLCIYSAQVDKARLDSDYQSYIR